MVPESPQDYDTPQSVSHIDEAVSIVAGTEGYCVLLSSGDVNCWGVDDEGQIGNGNVLPNDGGGVSGFDTPEVVTGVTDAVSMAGARTCHPHTRSH